MRAHIRDDGTLYGIGEITGEIEVDVIPDAPMGTPLRLDPDDPRRAIPCVATVAKRAAAVRLEAAIAAKQRQMALARLTIEDEYPGAAEAQTKLDVEIKAMAVAADAAGDWPAVEALKG